MEETWHSCRVVHDRAISSLLTKLQDTPWNAVGLQSDKGGPDAGLGHG